MAKIKDIKVYTTSTCPYCKMVKEFLKDHDLDFKEVDVSENQTEAERMVEKTGQMGVPVTEISMDNNREKFIVGFDENALKKTLGIK